MSRAIAGFGMAAALMLPGVAGATLIDRGNGLIYDDVLDITWLQDANYAVTSGYTADNAVNNGSNAYDNIFSDGRMGWDAAVAWADQLVYQGYDDWRLPTLGPIDGSTFHTTFSNNASTDVGYAKTTTDGSDGGWRDGSGSPVSEMGHMFYVNLGNLGFCTPNDTDPTSCNTQSGWGLTNTGLFANLQSSRYWSGLESTASIAWNSTFAGGNQSRTSKDGEHFAWAVRSGDVAAQGGAPGPGEARPVPVSAPWLLAFLALALGGLGARRAHRERVG